MSSYHDSVILIVNIICSLGQRDYSAWVKYFISIKDFIFLTIKEILSALKSEKVQIKYNLFQLVI